MIINQLMTSNILNSSPKTNPFLGKSTPMEWSMLISNKNDKNNVESKLAGSNTRK